MAGLRGVECRSTDTQQGPGIAIARHQCRYAAFEKCPESVSLLELVDLTIFVSVMNSKLRATPHSFMKRARRASGSSLYMAAARESFKEVHNTLDIFANRLRIEYSSLLGLHWSQASRVESAFASQ
jgi:hypothetical protein